MERGELIETIPAEVLDRIRDRKVVDVGFGAGPSCIAGKSEKYDTPVALETAIEWIENYCRVLRKAYVTLDDGTTLYFDPIGFIQYDDAFSEQSPHPGVEIDVKDDDEEVDYDEDFFQYCDCCGNKIRYGNAFVEIERLVEQIDINPDGEGLLATVIDSAPLAYICYSCSDRNFDPRCLRRQLAELLELPPPVPVVNTSDSDMAQTPEPCDCCGLQLNPGNAMVGLDIMIAQIDKPEGDNDSSITPIYTEALFAFCAACGNKMGEERLREAVEKVLIKVAGAGDDNDEDDDPDGEEKYADDNAVEQFLSRIESALQYDNELDTVLAAEPAQHNLKNIEAGKAGFFWPVTD